MLSNEELWGNLLVIPKETKCMLKTEELWGNESDTVIPKETTSITII
jgi:hypothetical protein